MTHPRTIPMPHTSQPHLKALALDKAYRKGEIRVPVLRGVDISVHHGEFLSIVGQSGSGKSTLMHLLGLLDSPDVGQIFLNGERIDTLSAASRDKLRNRIFGFVFQFYHLLPELTLLENVLSPLMIRYRLWEYWSNRSEIRQLGIEMIEKVGLGHRLKHRPAELSGGEMQRAAIARSLIGHPSVLLADEPTGNLDARTGDEIMSLLHELNETDDLTIVMVTHDDAIARQAERIVCLSEGRIQSLDEAA